ncbi:hypothetical protein LGK99_07225 [Clostridium algidicarnis]|uniref:hypothetical protein n=1 Tax=Clostridium algidicarnis TaxID=37659 RepID=UPI001CF2A4A9|nr:hypothetical protein [Clostridium algidicarnis]MCB2286897.1 hypothetical protein [Clostridium algidicarnis]
MFNIQTKEEKTIKFFCDGILIIEEVDYNSIISTINEAIKIIQDEYQLQLLNGIEEHIAIKEVA